MSPLWPRWITARFALALLFWLIIGAAWTWAGSNILCKVRTNARHASGKGLFAFEDSPALEWPRRVPSDWPGHPDWSTGMSSWFESDGHLMVHEAIVPNETGSALSPRAGRGMLTFSIGWPCRCLGYWMLTDEHKADGSWFVPSGEWHGEELIPGTRIMVFIAPIWPGFALNTIFYAAIAWSLWQVPLTILRTRRRRTGRCARCGYDLKGLAAGSTCPECGRLPTP